MAKEENTILLVDDNQADAKLLERNLHRAGVTLPTVILSSGKEAIDFLEARLPKTTVPAATSTLPLVIFLDLKLGDLDGIEVLKWITAQPSLRRVLVIIHSGIATPRDIDALYAAGANSFLRKANDIQELQSLVEYFKGHFSKP